MTDEQETPEDILRKMASQYRRTAQPAKSDERIPPAKSKRLYIDDLAESQQGPPPIPAKKRKHRSRATDLSHLLHRLGRTGRAIGRYSTKIAFASSNVAGKLGAGGILYAYYSQVHPLFMQYAQDKITNAPSPGGPSPFEWMHGVFYGSIADVALYAASWLSFPSVRNQLRSSSMWEYQLKPGLMGFGGAVVGSVAGQVFATMGVLEAFVPCVYLGTVIGTGIGINEVRD